MEIKNKTLTFKFRMRGDENWNAFQQPLGNLRQFCFTDDETLAENIKEHMYAMDKRTYSEPDEVEYAVGDFWNDIVLPCHAALYPAGKHPFDDL